MEALKASVAATKTKKPAAPKRASAARARGARRPPPRSRQSTFPHEPRRVDDATRSMNS